MTLKGSELMSYSQSNQQLQSQTGDFYCHYPDYYHDFYHNYYPIYYPETKFITEKSKVDIAFKIITKLLENKTIKEITARELIKLTNDISELL